MLTHNCPGRILHNVEKITTNKLTIGALTEVHVVTQAHGKGDGNKHSNAAFHNTGKIAKGGPLGEAGNDRDHEGPSVSIRDCAC